MLKSYAPDIALAGDAAKQMDAIIANIMDYLASTASGWLGRRKTLDVSLRSGIFWDYILVMS